MTHMETLVWQTSMLAEVLVAPVPSTSAATVRRSKLRDPFPSSMDERWTALPFRNTVMLAMGSSVWTSHVASKDVGFGWKRFTLPKTPTGSTALTTVSTGAATLPTSSRTSSRTV